MINTVDETVSPLLDPVINTVDETVSPLLDPVINTVDETVSPLLDPVINTVDETLSPLLPVDASTPPVVGPHNGSNDPVGNAVSDAPPAFNPPVPAGQVDNVGATSPLASPEPTASSPGVPGRTDIGSPSGMLPTLSSGHRPIGSTAPAPALNLRPAGPFTPSVTTAVRNPGVPAPPAPAPGGAAPAGSSGSTGFMFSMFLACLAALIIAALAQFSNLCIRPARTPSAVFLAVLERPG